MKKACCSNVRDPENRSKKSCVCGGHSLGARKKRKPWRCRLREQWKVNQPGADLVSKTSGT